METKKIILHICSFVVTMTILWLLGRWATRISAPKGVHYRYSTPLRIVGVVILITLALIISEERAQRELRLFLAVVFVANFVYLVYMFTAHVSITDTALEKRSFFGKRVVPFSSISEIRARPQEYVICHNGRSVLKLSRHIDGIDNLIRLVRKKTGLN